MTDYAYLFPTALCNRWYFPMASWTRAAAADILSGVIMARMVSLLMGLYEGKVISHSGVSVQTIVVNTPPTRSSTEPPRRNSPNLARSLKVNWSADCKKKKVYLILLFSEQHSVKIQILLHALTKRQHMYATRSNNIHYKYAL